MKQYPEKTPFKVTIESYRVILKAILPYQPHHLHLVSSITLAAKGSTRKYSLEFRREREINDPTYDSLNDVIHIDFSIEETTAVLELLKTEPQPILELKDELGQIRVELSTGWHTPGTS